MPSRPLNPDYSYNAIVVKIVDADTIDFRVDLGFYMTAAIRFRLIRINAPELRSKSKKERAKAMEAKTFVVDRCAAAKSVSVISRKTEKFGRWLCEVYLDGVNLNDLLLSNGLAKKYSGIGPISCRSGKFISLDSYLEQARNSFYALGNRINVKLFVMGGKKLIALIVSTCAM